MPRHPARAAALVAAVFMLGACAAPGEGELPDPGRTSPSPGSGAPSQARCQPRPALLALLAERYGEAPIAGGIARNGALVEVLATPDGRTWSVMVTGPRGRSCLVVAGDDWRRRALAPQGPEA